MNKKEELLKKRDELLNLQEEIENFQKYWLYNFTGNYKKDFAEIEKAVNYCVMAIRFLSINVTEKFKQEIKDIESALTS
jgi:hypothetical protein